MNQQKTVTVTELFTAWQQACEQRDFRTAKFLFATATLVAKVRDQPVSIHKNNKGQSFVVLHFPGEKDFFSPVESLSIEFFQAFSGRIRVGRPVEVQEVNWTSTETYLEKVINLLQRLDNNLLWMAEKIVTFLPQKGEAPTFTLLEGELQLQLTTRHNEG